VRLSGDYGWWAGRLFRRGQSWNRDHQNPLIQFGLQAGEIQRIAQSQLQPVVPLGGFEMEGLPVGTDELAFACGHEEVGAANRDLNAVGFDSGHIDGKLEGVRQAGGVELGHAKRIHRRLNGRPIERNDAAVGGGGVGRVHGSRNEGADLGLGGRAFSKELNEIREAEGLELKARARLILLPARHGRMLRFHPTRERRWLHNRSPSETSEGGGGARHGGLYSLTDTAWSVPSYRKKPIVKIGSRRTPKRHVVYRLTPRFQGRKSC
jgi:hypothetical protein